MTGPSDGDAPLTVELYVRSLAPRVGRDRVQLAVRRLDALAAAGAVDDLRIRVTGDAIPASPGDCVTEYGATLARRLVAFRDWATLTGRELAPGFDRRRVPSSFTGQDYDAVVPPALCLAEFSGDRLRFVAPCIDGGTPVTVERRLAELEQHAPTDVTDDRSGIERDATDERRQATR